MVDRELFCGRCGQFIGLVEAPAPYAPPEGDYTALDVYDRVQGWARLEAVAEFQALVVLQGHREAGKCR